MWIRIEKEAFDIIGVVLSSFTLTGICVLIAIALGACCGLVLIRRGRHRRRFEPDVSLDLRA